MSTTEVESRAKREELSKKRKKRKAEKHLGNPAESIAITPNSPPLSTKRRRSNTKAAKSAASSAPPEAILENVEESEEPPSKKRKLSITEIEVDLAKPEPPSKKALRRLKKGKPLPPPKSGVDTSSEPEREKPKKAEIEKRSGHGIWIGNLPWSTTKTDLRTFLTSNADITDETITRINMPSPDDGKPANKTEESKPWKKQHNKGFAYIDFSTPEAVQQALELSEHLLSGRAVLIKDAKSFEGRPQKTKEKSRNDGKPPSKRVFVGNLRYDTTEESLKEHFERCGAIENVMVATFEDSGKCKGYAWVTFEGLEAAESAVRGYALAEQEEDLESALDEDNRADESQSGYGEEEAEGVKGHDLVSMTKPPKIAMKKVWVDKIHKRPIRREFAEDAQVRYKKRYGKDGTKGKSATGPGPDGRGDGNVPEKVKAVKQAVYCVPTLRG